MKDLKAIIFDLDGVIYRGNRLLKGVKEVLDTLRDKGLRIFFLTNNSTKSRTFYSQKLKRMGIENTPDEIMTSAYATALYLKENKSLNILVIGESGLKQELLQAGHNLISGEETEKEKIDCVVVGLDRKFNYKKLSQAQKAILNGARFVATNRDPTFPTETGIEPGGGSIVAAIETATNVKPLVVGKPQVYSVKKILDLAGLKAHEALIVGDRLDTDILVGKRLRLRTALVLTGVTDEKQVREAPNNLQPDWVLSEMSELLDVLKEAD